MVISVSLSVSSTAPYTNHLTPSNAKTPEGSFPTWVKPPRPGLPNLDRIRQEQPDSSRKGNVLRDGGRAANREERLTQSVP